MSDQEPLTPPLPTRDDPSFRRPLGTDQPAGGTTSTPPGGSAPWDAARDPASTATRPGALRSAEPRDDLRAYADAQKDRLAAGLGDLSRQLRAMGERGDPGPVAAVALDAGVRAQRAADRLRRGGVDDALGQLRGVGRNRPGLALLGAFGLGLAAGRLGRSTASGPYERATPAVGPGPGESGRAEPAAGAGPAVPTGDAVPADEASHAAYGAPTVYVYEQAVPTSGRVPGTAPVSDQPWGT